VYFESFRNSLIALDGGNLYLDYRAGFGRLGLEGVIGTIDIDGNAIEYQAYERELRGDFDEADIVVGRLEFEPSAVSGLSFGLSYLDVHLDLNEGQGFSAEEQLQALFEISQNPLNGLNYVTSVDINAKLTLFSVQYGFMDWVLSGEYLHIDSSVDDVQILSNPVAGNNAQSEAYYFQLEWQQSEKASVYARADFLYFDKDDRDGTRYSTLIDGSPITRFSESITGGVRWYFRPNISLTLEYSKHSGVASLLGPDDQDYGTYTKHWDLFVSQFAFHF
jgi:hypothetical protein